MTISEPPLPNHLTEGITVKDLQLIGHNCALYRPSAAHIQSARPLIFYMHGGGFVSGSAEDSDYITRKLCADNVAFVVSIDYPLAPEYVFPSALEYCLSVIALADEIAEANAFKFSHIVLAGDSAGGNLAMACAVERKRLGKPVSGLVVFAPWLDMDVESYPSYNLLIDDNGVFDAQFMRYARSAYTVEGQWKNPLVSPFYCDAADLPPSFFTVGSGDPLACQTKDFFARSSSIGLRHLNMLVYPKLPHCFYSFPGIYEEELDCYERIKKFLATVTGDRE